MVVSSTPEYFPTGGVPAHRQTLSALPAHRQTLAGSVGQKTSTRHYGNCFHCVICQECYADSDAFRKVIIPKSQICLYV